MKHILYSLLLVVTVFLAGCSKDPGKSGPLARPISNKALQEQLIVLSDTLTGKWNIMMWSDSVKMQKMQALLTAIPPDSISAEKRANLQKAIRRLPTLKFDRRSMADSDLIDAYDLAHDSVYQALQAYLPPADVETGVPQLDSLRQEVKTHHEEVVFYRARYDLTAKEMNTLLRRYRKRLPKLGKPYDTLQPAPLFQWIDKSGPQPIAEE